MASSRAAIGHARRRAAHEAQRLSEGSLIGALSTIQSRMRCQFGKRAMSRGSVFSRFATLSGERYCGVSDVCAHACTAMPPIAQRAATRIADFLINSSIGAIRLAIGDV